MPKTDEARRGRRVRAILPAQLVCGTEQYSTQTENVSLLGTYVQLEREIPSGTQAKLILDLSGTSEGGQVQCEGVVVRCENLRPDLFGLGIFFNQFLEDGEAKLDRLIDLLLKKQNEEAQRYFEERDRLRKERMRKKLAEKRRKRRKRGRPPKKRRSKSPRKTS